MVWVWLGFGFGTSGLSLAWYQLMALIDCIFGWLAGMLFLGWMLEQKSFVDGRGGERRRRERRREEDGRGW